MIINPNQQANAHSYNYTTVSTYPLQTQVVNHHNIPTAALGVEGIVLPPGFTPSISDAHNQNYVNVGSPYYHYNSYPNNGGPYPIILNGMQSNQGIIAGGMGGSHYIGVPTMRGNISGHVKLDELRSGSANKLYLCSYPSCTYSTTRVSNLKVHERKHTKERPFICTVEDCGYRSAQRCNLKVHMSVHSEEKPYKCHLEGCTYSVVQKSNLIHHYEKCHPGIPCPVTSKTQFSNMPHLSGINNLYTLSNSQVVPARFPQAIANIVSPEIIIQPQIIQPQQIVATIATIEPGKGTYQDTDI